MKLTLKDIAKMAGTSPSTVSRAINNQGYIKTETRNAINKALQETGYLVGKRSKSDSNQTSNLVLITVESLENSIYRGFISGINKKLLSVDMAPLVYVQLSDRNGIQMLNSLTYDLNPAGVILLSAKESPELNSLLLGLKCPFVLLNRSLRQITADTVVMNNHEIGYMATKLLIESGHKKILHLAGPSESSASLERRLGYEDALHENHLEVPSCGVFAGDLSYKSGVFQSLEILKHRDEFTAIYSANDTMATGLIDTFYENGLRCPDDYSLICTDNTIDIVKGKVAVTAIGYDSETMGEAAAELLYNRINHPLIPKRTISFSPNVILRNSIKNIN